jgi:alpha-mannosidase
MPQARWGVLVLGLLFWTGSAGAQQKRIYAACDDHTDYLWAADEDTYRQAFLDMLDYYIAQADDTIAAGTPADFQGRFNCDGSFWLWTYEQNKPAADWNHLLDRVRSGHIGVAMNTLVTCFGGEPAEATLRGMYYAGRLQRRYGLSLNTALAMEDQTLPWGLASLWAGSGVRWSWRGICNCATRVPAAGDREHDIYWYTGPDGQRVLLKWNTWVGNQNMGGYAECWNVWDTVNLVTSNGGFQTHYPYPVIGCFGRGWDNIETMTDDFIVAAPAMSDATRRVIVSNEQDFFADFQANYGLVLPTESRSYGNEWELYCASLAETSASVKRSVEKLRAAEALAAVVTLFDPAFMAPYTAARDQAYMDLGLYWEHAWTANGAVPRDVRAAWQRRLATEIASYVDTLQADSAAALGRHIAPSPGPYRQFYVFNQLGWARSDFADLPWSDAAPVHVVDVATGAAVPMQFVVLGGQRYLRIQATSVPSIGYRLYTLVPGAAAQSGAAGGAAVGGIAGLGVAPFDAGTLPAGNAGAAQGGGQGTSEDPRVSVDSTGDAALSQTDRGVSNGRYSLTVSTSGAISSLIDRNYGNRQFAQVVSGRVINDLGPSAGVLTVENDGPVSTTLKAVASAPVAHTTRITLYQNSDRIDIANDISANFSNVMSYAFSFALTAPTVRHEEVGAIARARLTTAGGDYSPRQARYDWLTLNHFADMTGSDNMGITLSNADCYFFRVGYSTPTILDTQTPQLSALIGGQVDGVEFGIQGQGGDTSFHQRFALRTHQAYDPVAAMKFALEHQNPLVCGLVSGATASLSASVFSAISPTDPSVLLWSLKPADDGAGAGLVLRLWNVSEAAATTVLQLAPRPIRTAQRCTHIETDIGSETVTASGLTETFARQQMRTFRVLPVVPGDINGDGQTDRLDLVSLAQCMSGPQRPPRAGCTAADSDGDGDVDVVDFVAIQQDFTAR